MQVDVYSMSGQKTGTVALSKDIFDVAVKPAIVHDVYVAQRNNARQSWADTKKRGEVQGGGKKPWPQKGTGRARHGSIRSPIWKGGGVAFGPLSVRNYHTKINKKTRRLALAMCLADKAAAGRFVVVEDFNFSQPKTKDFVALLQNLSQPVASWLVLTPSNDLTVRRMSRNIPRVDTEIASQINVVELVDHQAVLISKSALHELERTFGPKQQES